MQWTSRSGRYGPSTGAVVRAPARTGRKWLYRASPPASGRRTSSTIKASANAHLADQGIDAGNQIIGRRRHLGCDTLGLLMTVLVTAASVPDNAADVTLLSHIAPPRMTKTWADAGSRTTAIAMARDSASTPHASHRLGGGAQAVAVLARAQQDAVWDRAQAGTN